MLSNHPPLHEYSADQLLSYLSDAQERAREAEIEHARAKAKFESTEAVLAEARRHQDDKPLATNLKGLIKNDELWVEAHKDYLLAWQHFQSQKDAQARARAALDLWQTVRADVRRV